LPTLVSRGAADYDQAFAAYDTFARAADAVAPTATVVTDPPARALGLHLEGPLLAAERRGAHPRAPIEQADAALVDRLAEPRRVRVVTLAPERDGVPALVARLCARGIVVALGHTDATFEAFTVAVDAGATLATHMFNAMSPLHHRAPAATGAALTDDRVTALMIADGVHTHPATFKLAFRAKGGGRLALVTDAAPGAGLGPGPSRLGGQSVVIDQTSARLPDGTLAGSTLTMDHAVRNAVAFAGLTAGQAVRLATAVPARVLGLADRGTLSVGARADLVLLDEALNVTATYVGGGLAYARAGSAAGAGGT
jgi:N-acetylglucosamine-6-phosphate deacetylase